MADEKIELSENEQEKGKGGMMKMIIMGVVGIVLLGGTVFGTLYLGGGLEEEPVKSAEQTSEQTKKKSEAIYLPLDPPFTISLDSDTQRRYLQVKMSVMARDVKVIDGVRRHRPAIRNGLNFLLASKSYKDLSTREGKETLRDQAEEEIRKILADNGENAELEALYFTDLVID